MLKTKEIVLTGIFTALIIAGSLIKIPIYPVPIALTYLVVNFVILMAERKTATLSVMLYIIIGLVGLPVFSFGGGIGYVLNLTFGYILGFFFSSVTGGYLKGKSFLSHKPFAKNLAVSIVNLIVIYTFGVVYALIISSVYLSASVDLSHFLTFYVLIFIPGDILSAILSSYVAAKLKRNGNF